jgi:hypothetical protein
VKIQLDNHAQMSVLDVSGMYGPVTRATLKVRYMSVQVQAHQHHLRHLQQLKVFQSPLTAMEPCAQIERVLLTLEALV